MPNCSSRGGAGLLDKSYVILGRTRTRIIHNNWIGIWFREVITSFLRFGGGCRSITVEEIFLVAACFLKNCINEIFEGNNSDRLWGPDTENRLRTIHVVFCICL